MILLIFCGDVKYCPYIKRYIERLEQHHCDYQVLFWNRSGFEENVPANWRSYDVQTNMLSGKIKKAVDFLGFYFWLQRQIKQIQPDQLIFLSTLTGILLSGVARKYAGKYIFDIRDYSYEHIPLFYRIEKRVIEQSAFTAISSRGFQSFLPEHDYVIAHNFNRNDMVKNSAVKKHDGPIRFVWNGLLRYFEYQKKYIDALKNDERFLLVYHGGGALLEKFVAYCEQQEVHNVVFTGTYDNNNKAELLQDADLLNNCYGRMNGRTNKTKFAVSNRFYDGVIYHIPQVVEPEGFKTDWVLEAGVGINLSPEDDFANKLYEYYTSLQEKSFDDACDRLLQAVLMEDDTYIQKIDAFICPEIPKA